LPNEFGPDEFGPDASGFDRPGVLVTRPEPGASATGARLAELGFAPLVAPLLQIRPRPAHLPGPGRLQAVLVTSFNALPVLAGGHRLVPLYTVGDATAARARALGFAAVTSAAGDAATLAALVGRACRPAAGPLLLAVGARQGRPLAAALRGQGFSVLRRTLYAAEPVSCLGEAARRALAEGRIAAALFFSAETAATFARLIADAGLVAALASVMALAIAEPAAAVLRRLPFRAVRVALRPNEEALLAMLA
jgi:uroporphyrinogen-III synthase